MWSWRDLGSGRCIGTPFGLIGSSVLGGLASVATGGKFANGGITAAFGYLFNACGSRPDCTWTGLLLGAAGGAYIGTPVMVGTGGAAAPVAIPASVAGSALVGLGGFAIDVGAMLGELGANNIRKNQTQTDIDGNRLDANRPDLQYDLDGIHHNHEFDTMRGAARRMARESKPMIRPLSAH